MSLPFLLNRFQSDKIKPVWEKRFGVDIEKGVVLTEDYVVAHEALIRKYFSFFTAYPDLFLDIIQSTDTKMELFFYQRILARVAMRFPNVFVTAPRAAAKSFISIIILFIQCIFIPGTQRSITTPGKEQAAKIAWSKILEIYRYYPLLRREVEGGDKSETPGNSGKDYTVIKFRNGSKFDVAPPLDTTRGQRRHGVLIDEVRDHDENKLNEIIIPLLNVARPLPNGLRNPREPNYQRINMTSAGVKTSFAYSSLISMFEASIINPRDTFVLGFDYRVPMMHGLLDKKKINEIKADPSYNFESFSREYGSVWSGSSEESWFRFDKVSKKRTLKNPELRAINRGNLNQFYLFSVDVGRLHDQTVCSIFRVNPQASGIYYSSLVNMVILGKDDQSKVMTNQAIDLKSLIEAYQPTHVIIDINGLGRGLADLMITPQRGPNGREYPAYGFMNDDNYKKVQNKGVPQILYAMVPTATLNAEIHVNAFNRMNSGRVFFLVKESEAKSLLMSTKKGQRMTLEERVQRLMPHELTSILFQEMANLKLKKGTSGTNNIALEQINSRFPKDKYSSFSYGLWLIKLLEDENMKKVQRQKHTKDRKLVFYSGR